MSQGSDVNNFEKTSFFLSYSASQVKSKKAKKNAFIGSKSFSIMEKVYYFSMIRH